LAENSISEMTFLYQVGCKSKTSVQTLKSVHPG